MLGDMNSSQERAILAFMMKVTSITDLGKLLEVVVQELPGLVGAMGCWIYLQPEYVREYSGVVRRNERDINEVDLLQAYDDFIVLAATNLESKKSLIGKAFFAIGEGITGWVYKNGKHLRILDTTDAQELSNISPDIHWANNYNDGDELYQLGDKRRLLAIPLILDNETIGTLKFHATLDKQPFTELSQEFAVIVSQIVSGALRQSWMVSEQRRIISQLIETSNKNSPTDVIADVTKSMKDMINCSRAECFLKNEDGTVLKLNSRNGSIIHQSDKTEFKRGYSLIGWVFKTGLPLIISDIKQFVNGTNLTDDTLEKISNTRDINDEDRYLKCEEFNYYSGTAKLNTVSFLAVPIKSRDKEVQGVLTAYWNNVAKTKIPIDLSQLMLISSFASTIALSLENDRQRMLGELLTELGNLNKINELFDLVTEKIPKLVSSSGCSIFKAAYKHGAPILKLAHTSRKSIILEDGKLPDVEYLLGEGKTGMCGAFQSTLIANHYGMGRSSIENLNQELARIDSDCPNDVTDILLDSSGKKIGLFHMQLDEKLHLAKRMEIHNFSKKIVASSTGVISNKLNGGTWSFVAVPICSDRKLLGVITLARPTPETPFLAGDISLLKSISGRLSSVMNNLRTLEQRKRLVISLAHEINTPLIGIIADSENIFHEANSDSELHKMAKHNLGQVLRLHMQTSTIMSVLSEQTPVRKFSEHSIYRPLKEACELFESEASHKGCDILGPKARDGSFPSMEMSLFDLTIAFKNIVHNAVKYSFTPPVNLTTHRTIKVWGEWDKERENHYLVHVQNYGVGISKEEIENRLIFDEFYRGEKASDRRRTGAGFGLAHARLIIEDLHNGYIHVTSKPQGGDAYLTNFSVSLPIKHVK